MNKINPDLLNKIKKLTSINSISEVELVQKLSQDKQLRLKKDAIKFAVKEYYVSIKKNQQQSATVIKQDIAVLDKIKKKRKLQQEFVYYPKPEHSLEKLGGIDTIVEQIKKYLFAPIISKQLFQQLNVKPSKGILLIGSMGSGKTHLGFSILTEAHQKYNIETFYITASQILHDSQQSLLRLFKMASQKQPSMIFIDDIENICTKQNKKQSSALLSFIGQLNRISEQQIYLIASTSFPEKVQMNLKRSGRFDKQFVIDNPNEENRAKILEKLFENVKTSMKGSESKLATITAGYVAADLVGLLRQAALQSVLRINAQTSQNTERMIIEKDFLIAHTKIQPLSKKEGFTSIPDVTLDDVGALGSLKQQLKTSIILPIKQREKFKKMNIALSAGVLLHGPPGCGKTMLAKAIANQAKANFITVKGPQLLSKYVGQSQQSVRKVFQRAKISAPCIIFFDQFDALAPKRQDQGNQVTERVVNTLLNQLNGVQDRKMIFVIAATNRFDIIDEAILRSGRIQKHLLVPIPTPDDRTSILKTITRKLDLNQNINIEQIAKNPLCQGFSGADLNHLVKQACILAILDNREKLQLSDFLSALQKLILMRIKVIN